MPPGAESGEGQEATPAAVVGSVTSGTTSTPAVVATATLGGSLRPEPSSGAHTALPGPNQKPEDVLAERFGRTRSALSEGTVIQGKLSFDTPVRIDGKLSGEIFSSKVLIVGPTGKVDANLEVAALVVLGRVSGTITASERVELWSGAELQGVVRSPVLVIQEGGNFSGTSHMLEAQTGFVAGLGEKGGESIQAGSAASKDLSTQQIRPTSEAPKGNIGADSAGAQTKGTESKGDLARRAAVVESVTAEEAKKDLASVH